jgi:paraquat-inducible protein B
MQNNGSDANLTEAVQQLSDAARSIRSLSDYLSRHPEALLRGKGRSP